MTEVQFSRDTLLKGTLGLWQPAKGHGYRYNLDPVLLSGFMKPAQTVLDLGAGCGVLGLLMLARGSQRLIAVERDPVMAQLIQRNAQENGWEDRVTVLQGDLRELELPKVDCVVSNPPYFKADSGKPSPNAMKDAARFERHGTLDDFVRAALNALAPNARASFVMRQERQTDLLESIQVQGGSPTRICSVHAHSNAPCRLTLLEMAKGDCTQGATRSRLDIHQEAGHRAYTAEVEELLKPIPNNQSSSLDL